VKGAIVELAETLVFVGMVRGHVVGKSEEKESEGFSRDKVKAGPLDAMGAWLGFKRVARGLRGLFHLFESVYDGGVELMLIGEVVFKVAAGCKCLRTEGTLMASRESTKETAEVELMERRGDILTVLTMKGGKVARVHPGVLSRGK
jgi:hypothetical protein